MFKPGDKIRKKCGTPFSNGELICTVNYTSDFYGHELVWLEETGKNIKACNVVFVEGAVRCRGVGGFKRFVKERT